MCRNYIKGRDYYDYQWFINHGVSVNEELLKNALLQTEGKEYSRTDIVNRLQDIFDAVDIEEAKKDVRRFLETPEVINAWSNSFFADTVKNIRFINRAAGMERRHRGK